MFDKTVVTQLGFDAVTGLATSIVKSEAKDALQGSIALVTSALTKDIVVTGMGRTLGMAATHYAAMQIARKKHVGNYAINPLALA